MRRLRVTTTIVACVLACVAVVIALTVWVYVGADSEAHRVCALAVGGLAALLLLASGVVLARQWTRPGGAGVAGVCRDEIDRHVDQRTAELIRASRLKGQLLANMSHELRTPLNAIIGFAEALRDGLPGEPTPEQREFAQNIHQAGLELLRMIDDLLDLSKVEVGAMDLILVPCDLAGMVDGILRVARGLARRGGVELVADVLPRPLELTADPMKLRHVLYNLLSNAIRFTGPGGLVTVRGRLETELVRIQVQDTGAGISPEDLVSVFEEFTEADAPATGRREETGLGLALTKRLVELHGGEVTVESEPGKGSTFTITLLRDLVTGEGE